MNNKIIQTTTIIFAIILFVSCNSSREKTEFNTFSKEIVLKADSKKSEGIISARDIVGVKDSILIVTNYKDNYAIYLVNKYDFSLIKKSIKRGRGPGEINSTAGIFYREKNDKLYIPNYSKNEITQVPISTLLVKEKINSLKSFITNLNDIYFAIDKMLVINDSIILTTGYKNNCITRINNKKHNIKAIGELPPKPQNIRSVHYTNMYTRFLTYNSSLKQIAVGFLKMDKLISYNLKGKIIFERVGPDKFSCTYKNQYNSDVRRAYESIKSDNNYIYCLYSGRKAWKFKKGATSLNNIKDLYPKSILIFDWEGNPKLRVNLSHECRDFIIDKETNRLITLSLEEKPFHVYDFSKIKQALD